ncbi:hypothetical protein RRG08_028921 [Elysia crispata]|uniref:3',5'-cyclic-AMP phosphodiesterase n=1 Tax=Elysia crispata TaxID=231223 RepID=A0AAE1E3S1_9GAST|nr:hypothetical protein RRG08_028921 [Elysia crispata]
MQKLNFLSPLFHKNGKKGESGRSGGRKGSTENRKSSTDKSDKGSAFNFGPSSSSSSSSSKRKAFTLFTSSRHAEDLIVTPFAQILASLRSVRSNYVNLTNVPPGSRERPRRGSSDRHAHGLVNNQNMSPQQQGMAQLSPGSNRVPDESYMKLAMETLEELDWCMEQLETIQTHRSVSDMASSKFKRMLNRELSHFAESSKSGNQIAEYICTTYLEDCVVMSTKTPFCIYLLLPHHARDLQPFSFLHCSIPVLFN